jgi:ABC-type amino acid transport substrate-binding protein
VQIGTSAAEMLEGDQKALADTFGELKTYETYNVAFNDLKAGAIDAVAIDMTTGAYLVSTASRRDRPAQLYLLFSSRFAKGGKTFQLQGGKPI